ncbi:thiamine pyrophosphate-binding protein [Herbiconiux sp. 11R-BC]|uniref:thiamine pyrophosphate-binding protein n=1 Tax=Herbiconiux sp. 11R-BC TaxID=3111637 RepID=UPI003C00D86E
MSTERPAPSSPAATFASRLVRAFAALGVRHAVVSPGSRSQALALALAELEREGLLAVHVRIDERVAAFTALGIARESGVPALVVTTSGTAVANLLPAVVEASHSGVPMVVLSADRPARLRGTGSNQTTWQPGMFGRFARAALDVAAPEPGAVPDARALAAYAFAAASGGALDSLPDFSRLHHPAEVALDADFGALGDTWRDLGAAAGGVAARAGAGPGPGPGPGPVQLNLQFVEPLSGAVEEEGPDARDAGSASEPRHPAEPRHLGEQGQPGDPRQPGEVALGAEFALAVDTSRDLAAGTGERAEARPRTLHLAQGPRTVVIAGADAGEAANAFALAAGWPLFAEVSSGAHFGPNLVVAYRTLLDHPDFGGRVERVVLFGHPTLSRQVPALVGRDDVELVVVRGAGEPVVPHPDAVVVDAVTADPEDRSDRAARAWTGQWVFASRELLDDSVAADEVAPPLQTRGGTDDLAGARDFARNELAALRAPVTRRALTLAVWRATWPHDRLVLGASRLIRELDAVAPGKKIPVHANRGVAGIDGTVATATGIALASQGAGPAVRGGAGASTGDSTGTGRGDIGRPDAAGRARAGTTRVLLGDVTLLHDVGALLFGLGETRPRLQLVVGNDGGGTIFDGLEVAGTADPEAFDRVMFTPHSVSLAPLAAAYGWEYRLVTGRGDLDSALASPPAGPSILEVALDR